MELRSLVIEQGLHFVGSTLKHVISLDKLLFGFIALGNSLIQEPNSCLICH